MLAIYRKEIRSYFINPIGYIYLGVFLVFSALLCCYTTLISASYSTSSYFTYLIFSFVILIPILTMRLFAEERKLRTEQLLLTAPVTITGMVMGKYLAALTLYVGGILISCVNFIPLYIIGAAERAGESDYALTHIGPVTGEIVGSVIAVILLGAALIFFAIALARTEAGFSIETVQSLLDTWKAAMLADRMEMRDAMLEMLERAYENSGAAGTQSAESMMDYYRRLMSDAALESELTRIFNVLPGAVAAVALIEAFLGQGLLLNGYDAAGMRSLVTLESEFLVLSLPAAIVYVVCMILSLIFDTSYAVPVVTAENLLVILTPGLCAVGWGALARFYRSVPPRGRGALIVPAIALLCCAYSSVFYVLAAYGAYATIFSAVRRAILRRGGPNPPAGGPFDGDNSGSGDDDNDSGGGNPFD